MRAGLFAAAGRCLALPAPDAKCEAVGALWADWSQSRLRLDEDMPVVPIGPPGRPEQPLLVEPSRVPRRRLGSAEGRAALVHAVAHIEFNAINLALDAVYRFRGMPRDYYTDWLSVAADEARHFGMLRQRLRSLGREYGDFPAHNGLWEMAEQTAASCLVRMALVPRVLEARGLDVTPGMIERLRAVGDGETARILEIILDEEVRHVAIGTRWFRHCCAERGQDPDRTFGELFGEYFGHRTLGPCNLEARYAAGFSPGELAALQSGPRATQPECRAPGPEFNETGARTPRDLQ